MLSRWRLRHACPLLVVLGCGPAAAEIDRATSIGLAASVLKVEAVDAQGRFHLGSAVVVAPRKVVTNCHVTRRAIRVSVLKAGARFDAPAQSSDIGHDLCVLKVPGLDGAAPARLAGSATLSVGQPVVAIGFTGGGIQLSEGEVVALHPLDGARVVQSSNWFNSGASGGGLFDANGTLVGVLTFRLRGGEQHYFSAPADWLRERVDHEPGFVPVRPLEGQTFWEQPAGRQPYFLQAASLERAGAWQPLRELAQRWRREAPAEAEAAYALAVADEALGLEAEALHGLHRCVELESAHSRGWQRLVRLLRRLGRHAEVSASIDKVLRVDARLARLLREELEPR